MSQPRRPVAHLGGIGMSPVALNEAVDPALRLGDRDDGSAVRLGVGMGLRQQPDDDALLDRSTGIAQVNRGGHPAWEEALVVAHHRLSRTPRSLNPVEFEDNPEWERLHRIFHRTLISQCGSNPLMGFCDHLADQLYRYRRVSIRHAFPTRKVGAEHQAIVSAVLDREIDRAVGLLERHYLQAANVILEDPSL